ncbi:DUF3089 domain-containing protein [Sphingomicrobium nitratireducens]|uniref:DUF3089 domain-containing protein n=1 Tax=Sphingomicrobium nitratireducens TaxID=2964666 RepID=UPI002240924F|nr:DUF3089 domain-containing protein [Sphingomicrobium nitratireducens]
MCARRFLILVAILTFMVVAGAFAIFQFGDRVLADMTKPTVPFEEPAPEPEGRYEKADAWLARPDVRPSPAEWRPRSPDGEMPPPATLAPRGAALFYVHPTTYLERDRWNAAMRPGGEAEARATLFVKSQASAFNAVADIYAPRYRQAAFGAFLVDGEDAARATDVAYRDVAEAFDAFLAAEPERPIILAGHSQGSLHLLRLLDERGDALKDRIVVAYIVGWPVDAVADLPATGLSVCRSRNQVGCLMSWQSFAEPANPNLVVNAWAGEKGLAGGTRQRANMVCTNPLTGGAEGSAPPSANPGLLLPEDGLGDARLAPGMVGARCHDGFLLLSGEIPDLGRYVLPGNNYHVYDYALFWQAVRADVQGRMAAWTSR